MKTKSFWFSILFLLLTTFNILLAAQTEQNKRELKNLKAFAKLYGYVRFFHPSDEAAKLDWNKFAIYGAEKVKQAKDDEELKNVLIQMLLPIAPTLQITFNEKDFNDALVKKPKIWDSHKLVAWQHSGVRLSKESNVYRSARIYKTIPPQNINLKISSMYNSVETNKWEFTGVKFFDLFPFVNETYKAKLDSSLYCKFPLTLFCDKNGTIPKADKALFKILTNNLGLVDTTTENINTRLCDVIISWNVFQHFYPYFDVVKVDWDKVLDQTLLETIQNKTADEFYGTLSKMVAKLEDGHGYIFYKQKKPLGGLPIRTEYIEGKIVITATNDIVKFHKGDVIVNIDGKTGIEELLEEEKYVSGSPQLKRYRTLNQFGKGENGSIAKLELLRNNKVIPLEYKREIDSRGFFFNQISEFDFPGIKKLEGDIYYINLAAASENEFLDSINLIAKAKGVIFDKRWNGKYDKDLKRIDETKLLGYLANEPYQSAFWKIPQIIYPDRENITFSENRWPLTYPNKTHIQGKVVFINEPSVVSYGESIMGIVEYYKMAETVGGITAGTNGNVNFINLPGGFRIMWTGMKVIKHDGSQHHLIGIKPTYPVERTIKAVKEGRDEYLEKAIEVIKKEVGILK